MSSVNGVLGHVVDDDRFAALPDLVAERGLDLQGFAEPGFNPKLMSSRTLQAIHRSSVTRATAAKRMPVVRQTMSRIVGNRLHAADGGNVLLERLAHAHGVGFIWRFAQPIRSRAFMSGRWR